MTNIVLIKFDITEMMLSSLGVRSSHVGQAFGRFDLLPGEEKCGSPVYRQAHSKEIFSKEDRQAHSKEIPTEKEFLLYR